MIAMLVAPAPAEPFGLAIVETRARTWNKSRDELMAERSAKVPLGKAGTAWDVANLALFLASDAGNFVNGIELHADGGMTLA